MQTGLRPPLLRAPDPHRDHGSLGRERDPGRALSTTKQSRLRLRVDRPLREDPREGTAADRLDSDVECTLVPLASTERDLTVQTERPPAPELVEELRRDQETCRAPTPCARHQGEHDAVERGHMVAGDDRRARRRDAIDSLDPRPERDPPEEPDEGDAEHPPSVQVAASSHARMLLARGPNDRMGDPRA